MSGLCEVVDDHVVRLSLPDASALDRREVEAAELVRDALLAAADDDTVKVIVVAGLAAAPTPVTPLDEAEPEARLLYTGIRGLHQLVAYCKKVVIAEVAGACGPTASALCLAADFAVATTESSFASPFGVEEANFPLAVLTMRENRTKAWMLRGDRLDAERARAAGFVNEVVEPAALRSTTEQLARGVALMPLDGITVSKMNVGAAFDVIGVGREFDAVEAGAAGGRS